MSDKQKYAALVDELRRGWSSYLSSGVDFFLRLRVIEQGGIWKLGNHDTFREFLRREFPDTLGFDRYDNVMRAIEEWGESRVRQVGIECAHAMVANQYVLKSPERKSEMVAAISQHIKEFGCSPGPAKILEIGRSIAPESREPCREVKAARKESAERAEIIRLQTRITELEKENAELKKELSRVNGMVHKAKPKAKARKAA